MRANRIVVSCLMGAFLAACGGAEPGEEIESQVETSTQELVDGTWSDQSNGGVPVNSVAVDGLHVCAALDSGVWHPGKLHLGECHYGMGGSEKRAITYRGLSTRTTYRWLSNTGVTPPNAVAGPLGATQLPVCTTTAPGARAHGKVHLGQCHYGMGGRELRTTNFQFLVDGY